MEQQEHGITYLDLDCGNSIVKVEREDEEVDNFDTSGGGDDMDLNTEDSFPVSYSYVLPQDNDNEDQHDDNVPDPSVNHLKSEDPPMTSGNRGRKKKTVTFVTESRNSPTSQPEESSVIFSIAPPKFASKEQFMSEMELSIKNIVGECINVLQKDPGEYHPFYLRVYKFTTIGKQLGFLNTESDVDSLWQQYDNFAKCQFERWKSDGQQVNFDGEQSAYLTYILTKKVIFQGKAIIRGKNSKQQNKQRLKELSTAESIAKKFRKGWTASGISDEEVRENLEYRLKYFQHVKHLAYPGDVIRINFYWKGLLNGFPSNECKNVQERLSEKYDSQPSPPPVKRSGRERKPPTRLEPEPGFCRKRKVNKEDEGRNGAFKSKRKFSATEDDKDEPKISGGIEGGTCTQCGKVMKTQLARHIREVHYKIYPASHKSIAELKMKMGDGNVSSVELEVSNTKMGGECPHCHKIIKTQLQYHILKKHGEESGQIPVEVVKKEQNIVTGKGKSVNGGECPHCGKLLTRQLQRHIREVHLKIKPTLGSEEKNLELEKLCEEQKKEEDEAEERDKSAEKKVSSGGKCPYCNKMLKKYLQYHIWRTHVTVEGKVINRPVKQDLKHLTAEQKREHWKEWQRLRRLNRTEEERQEESRKLRERYYKKINSMTPEELEEFRKRNRFQAFQKRVEQQFLPEEERERLKTIKFLSRQAWLDRKDDDWKEARKQQVKERVQAKRAVMTDKEREEERRRNKEWRKKLSGEKLTKYRESVRKSMKKYFDKLRRDNPDEYYSKVNNRENKLKWSGFLNYQRERTAKETPQQREARLLRYRVNQAKRKARQQLEKEGASPDEIESKLKEIEEQLRSQPKPVISSTYKPRLGARKPHNVPKVEVPVKKIKKDSEQQQQHQHPLLNTSSTQVVDTHQVVLEDRIVDSSLEHHHLHHQQQQINLVAVITPQHHQESSSSQQQQILYVPYHQVSMPAMSSSQVSSVEFHTTPTLSLVHCPTATQGASTNTTTATLCMVSSHTTSSATQITSHFDDSHFVSGPPSCAETNYNPGDDQNRMASSNFCHFPSAEQTTVICVVEPSEVPSSSSSLTETFTVPSVVPPQHHLTVDDLINASAIILESERASAPRLEPETIFKQEPTSTLKQAAMCDECGKTFTTQASVQVHKTVVHAVDPSVLICPKCQYHCSSTISLWNHFTTYHLEDVDTFPVELFPNSKTVPPTPRQPRTEPYKQVRSDPNNPHPCPQCSKSFVQKCTLDDHIRRTHEGKGHFCEVCGKDQQSPAKLWRHKVERHGMKDLPPPPGVPAVTCKYCSEIIMRGYEQHVKKRHPDQFEDFSSWYIPEKGTAPRRNLDEKVQCPHCPSMVKHKLLNRHIKNMHTSLPKHSCPECGIEFKRIDHLKKHYRDQHVVVDMEKKLEAKQLIKVTTFRNFTATCLLCQTEIVSKVLLRAHFVKDHHEIFQECQLASLPIFECSLCQEKFQKEVQLKSHMQATHPEKLFTCQHCGIFKYSQTELSAHERMHRKTERDRMRKQGLCSLCDFDAKLSLDHKMESKLFSEAMPANNFENMLREHVKTQHFERYFPCPNPNCDKFTVNKDDFQHHMARCQKNGVMNSKAFVKKTVNKLMVYCPECRKPFRFYQFNKHLHVAHKIKSEDEEIPCEFCKPRIFKCRRFYVAHMHLVHQIPFDQLLDLVPDDSDSKSGKVKKCVSSSRLASKRKRSQGRKRTLNDEHQIDMQICSNKAKNQKVFREGFHTDKFPSHNHCPQKRKKIGPKSKTQREGIDYDRRTSEKLKAKVNESGRKLGKMISGKIIVEVDVEKYRKLSIRVERMPEDLFKYYLARRVIIKDEPEC